MNADKSSPVPAAAARTTRNNEGALPSQPAHASSHQRKVSWGDQKQRFSVDWPSPVQQEEQQALQHQAANTVPTLSPIIPVLRTNLSDVSSLDEPGSPRNDNANNINITNRNNQMFSGLTSSSRQLTTSTIDSLEGTNIVNLDTILKMNPLESEAETLILKVRFILRRDHIECSVDWYCLVADFIFCRFA